MAKSTLGDDLIGDLTERFGCDSYVDCGAVSFLITAVDLPEGPHFEIWMQGACRGKHHLRVITTTESDFIGGEQIDLKFVASLESHDDELISYMIPIKRLGKAAGKTVTILVDAVAKVENRGEVLRIQNGTRCHDLAAAQPSQPLLFRMVGLTFNILFFALRPISFLMNRADQDFYEVPESGEGTPLLGVRIRFPKVASRQAE